MGVISHVQFAFTLKRRRFYIYINIYIKIYVMGRAVVTLEFFCTITLM